MKGRTREYIELKVHCATMTVSVPLDRVEEVGIRGVTGRPELDRLAEVLAAPTGQEESQWARRFKANRALISTGNPIHLAEDVMRTLITAGNTRVLDELDKRPVAV